MNNPADKRRKSILTSLFFRDGGAASLYALKDELQRVHNIAVSSDVTHSDLLWLHEMGLAIYTGEMAKITERGADVVKEAAPWPGGR